MQEFSMKVPKGQQPIPSIPSHCFFVYVRWTILAKDCPYLMNYLSKDNKSNWSPFISLSSQEKKKENFNHGLTDSIRVPFKTESAVLNVEYHGESTIEDERTVPSFSVRIIIIVSVQSLLFISKPLYFSKPFRVWTGLPCRHIHLGRRPTFRTSRSFSIVG